jgi:transposase
MCSTPKSHDLLLMVEGRSAFAQALVAHGGKAEQIELISMDMSPAYQSGASRFFPQAERTLSRVSQEHSKTLERRCRLPENSTH